MKLLASFKHGMEHTSTAVFCNVTIVNMGSMGIKLIFTYKKVAGYQSIDRNNLVLI